MDTTTSSFWRLAEWLDATGGASHTHREEEVGVEVEAPLPAEVDRLHTMEFETEFPAVVDWLAGVEGRIRNSIAPHSGTYLETREWLDRDAALAALTFFRDSCDLLPSEPFIYGTPDGEMVAEFETDDLRVTTVVAVNGTTMFGYRRDGDEFPTQCVIGHGSNRRRHEVKGFTQALGIGSYGKDLDT